jgi:hypothetical protein
MAPLNEEPVLVMEDNIQQLTDIKPIAPPLTDEEEPQASEEKEEATEEELVREEEAEESREAIEDEQDDAIETTLNFFSCCALPDKGTCTVCKEAVTFGQAGVKLDEETWSHRECEGRRHTCATTLQAKTRGDMGRAEAKVIRVEKRQALEEASAVKLQGAAKQFLENKHQAEEKAQIKALEEEAEAATRKAEEDAARLAAITAKQDAKEGKKFMSKIRKLFSGCAGKSSTTAAVDTEAHKVVTPVAKNDNASLSSEEVITPEEVRPEEVSPQASV